MTAFGERLRRAQPTGHAPRRWVFVPYDQLHDGIGPLAHEPAGELGIVLVESRAKARRRPYHKQKLALVLANLRHFALEQAARGVAVRHVATDGGYADALVPLVHELGPLRVQRPAERELREELAPVIAAGGLVEVPHDGWLTTPADFAALGAPPWRMDAFYRRVRRRTGTLMADGRPEGGKWSFDAENRKPWRGDPPPPTPPSFPLDDVAREAASWSNTTSRTILARCGASTCRRAATTPSDCGSGRCASACRGSVRSRTRCRRGRAACSTPAFRRC